MILLDLEIEDYKQFRGKHCFTPTPDGVVGIIGSNGAGKTTLFEAIEWCLYQPREIRSDEIPPRDAPDRRPRVRLRLANPRTGATYEVERSLKKNSAYAEIRQIDDSGAGIIATGSSAVSNYTATKLIGLEHKAFVATFFTRQKELSFFGALKPTERRREVGRLLGLETIRNAQELIAEERTAKRSVYQASKAQYEQESGERDFDAERDARNVQLAGIDQQISDSATGLIQAENAFRSATAARSQLVERREATFRLQSELATHQAASTSAETIIRNANDELARLAQLEAERPELATRAEQVDTHADRVTALEVERERFQRRQSLLDQQSRTRDDIDSLTATALDAIAKTRTRPVGLRESDPLAEIDGFLEDCAAVDASDSQNVLEQLQALQTRQQGVDKGEHELQRCQSLFQEIETKRDELLAGGHPDDAEAAATDQRDEAFRAIATFQASIDSHNKVLADFAIFTRREHIHVDGSICPTCGREIGPNDAAQIREHAANREREIHREIDHLTTEVDRYQSRVSAIDLDLAAIRMRGIELNRLTTRIQDGRAKIAEVEGALADARAAVAQGMADLGRSTPVTEIEITAQRERLAHERAIEQTRAKLGQLRETLSSHTALLRDIEGQIAAIGHVKFEAADLQGARDALDEARTARTRLDSIDKQLARRSEHAAAGEAAGIRLAEAQAEAARLEAEITANPIDEDELYKAEMQVEQARQKERSARADQEKHRRARQDVELALKQIDADQKRLAQVIERAEKARVEADDLDRMYKEFNGFEQFVARRVRPQLEEMTSDLVRVITENKYESVQLDDDYGVTVWDGELGPYPIEHFSGGERDVIALSARLALSRLIGSQAANPPSFLVLDEVFGSLDRERRTNVLEVLSTLAGSAESFRQLFVISHVDDVRLSPAFNEVWRVAELDDGSSRLENLNLTQGTEDL